MGIHQQQGNITSCRSDFSERGISLIENVDFCHMTDHMPGKMIL
jgi:hypothetical protein